jgi:tetratricopeptide (TPR) repeat protein
VRRKLLPADPHQKEQRYLGSDHPENAQTLSNVATLLRRLGRHAEAERILRDRLAARKKRLGADHPDAMDAMGQLGVALLHLGRLREAEAMIEKAHAARTRVSTPCTMR